MSTYDPPPTAPPGAPYRGLPPETTLSGLTEPQAREFHGLFLVAFAVFVIIAILAHLAAWSWRPWGHATEPAQMRTPPAATSMLTPSQASAPTLKAA